MASTAKAKAGKQLLFALCLLAVAIAGYLLTRSIQVRIADPGASTSSPAAAVPTSTLPATPEDGSGSRESLEGTYVCLPHRDTGGPQTLECALGLRTDDGSHYAVVGSGASAESASATTPTGARVRVTGSVVPVEASSNSEWQRYAIVGVINAASLERL